MKTFYKLATFTLMMTVLAVSAFAQERTTSRTQGPETTLVNLIEGQGPSTAAVIRPGTAFPSSS